ncbi:MAG TPA: hypothetical protein VK929_14165 [Longimicrobiales bacterium]|nr:hypothetical protein [Longimicrobiales bacterium]
MKNRFTARRNRVVLAVMAAVATHATQAAHAQDQDLPDAAAVIARYQEAVGGVQALAGYSSMRAVGELAMPAQGLSASMQTFAARPNRSAMIISIDGFGEIRTGVVGDTAWSMNPMEGPRLLQGAELTQTVEESAFESSLRPSAMISSATTVERTTLAGRPCLKVRLEWQSGRESFDCYSEETGLLVGTTAVQETNMGRIEAVTLLDDYRDFGGLRTPTRITIQTMGVEQIITIREVAFNDVDDDAFALPSQIRALIR